MHSKVTFFFLLGLYIAELDLDHVDALTSAKPYKFENVKLQAGSSIAAVVKTRIVDDDLYKDAKHGDVLVGDYHFTPVAHKLGRPATLVLPPAVPKDKEEEPKDKEPQKLVNLQIEMAKKIEDEEVKKRFLADLLESHSNHLPLLVARLESFKSEEEADVLAAADAIFDLVDSEVLARFNGTQKSDKTAQDRKNTKDFKEQQDALLKAFDRKLQILHKRKSADDESYDKINPSSASSTSSRSSVYSSYEALLAGFEKWAPASDNKLSLHLIQRDLDEERYASALTKARKILADVGESSDTPEAKEAREFKLAALRGLGWSLYLDMEDRKGLDKDILF
jgi:tripeptidyl-peptidase-2